MGVRKRMRRKGQTIWLPSVAETSVLDKLLKTRLEEKEFAEYERRIIPVLPKELKCKSCGAPLKQGQIKCEWCRTVYRWE